MKQNRDTEFVHLGLKDYQETWDYQQRLFDSSVALKIENRKLAEDNQTLVPNHLIFVHHPHVYTLGKSGDPRHLLLTDELLKSKQAKFYKINRGGDITYHGPGQIVGYPIIDLDSFFTDIHRYLRYLEEAVILTLSDYGIMGGRVDGLTGVWIDYETDNPRKICALGVKTSRWVTMHGFALNVNTNLEYFDYIVPCGIVDKTVTSMEKELGSHVEISKVEERLLNHLADIFHMNIVTKQIR